MEASDSLVKIIKALLEISKPIGRQHLTDFLTGKETRELEEMKLDDMETYGCGDSHDEDYWNMVLDAALQGGYIKSKTTKTENFVPTPAGKKFAKKPGSFEIDDEEDATGGMDSDSSLAELVMMAQNERMSAEYTASPRTQQQIKLIRAIDRKIALDDFAESESIALDEVLDELEALVKQGRKMDITYFTDEVIGEEYVDEVVDFFKEQKSDDLRAAEKEFGDVYNVEELRLARIVYWVKQM